MFGRDEGGSDFTFFSARRDTVSCCFRTMQWQLAPYPPKTLMVVVRTCQPAVVGIVRAVGVAANYKTIEVLSSARIVHLGQK